MKTDEKREWAKAILRERAEELGNIPHKKDFDEATLSRIKAFLGPWPRALESAGLKDIKKVKISRSKRKAIKAKRLKREKGEE